MHRQIRHQANAEGYEHRGGGGRALPYAWALNPWLGTACSRRTNPTAHVQRGVMVNTVLTQLGLSDNGLGAAGTNSMIVSTNCVSACYVLMASCNGLPLVRPLLPHIWGVEYNEVYK